MQMNAQTAVIDNDFVSHLAESRLDDDRLLEVLNIVFSELALSAVMHPLVYENELLADSHRIKLLFDSNMISKVEFEDIFQGDDRKRTYYIFLVENLYRTVMGEALPFSGEDILTCWARKKSLGEVHSIAMCLTCGCGIFLSDDADAKILKRYIADMAIGTVYVYNREEFVREHMQAGETSLNRRERQSLTHAASR